MYSYKLRHIDNKGVALFIEIQNSDYTIFIDNLVSAIALLNPEFILQDEIISSGSEMTKQYKTILGEFSIYLNMDEAIISALREELVLMIDSRLMIDPLFNKID
jgi:hypothetical protein